MLIIRNSRLGIISPLLYTIHPGQRIWVAQPGSGLATQSSSTDKPSVATNVKPRNKRPADRPAKQVVDKKFVWQWPLNKPYTVVKKFTGKGDSQGIDLQAQQGQPVYAAASGHVVYSGNGLIGYGNLVIVKHSDTFLSAYALNQKLYVKEGDKVVKGQKIATVGLNLDKKPTLHFEIRRYGKPVNPIKYLP